MPAIEPGDLVAVPSDYQTETPQIGLRFQERTIDGRKVRILQQCWGVVTYRAGLYADPAPIAVAQVWRDVPCVSEEASDASGS